MFGTETFSDHWKETVTCLQRVLETDEKFVAFEENCIGLDLDEETLHDIYFNNYHKFIRNLEKPLNIDMVLEYADTLYDRTGKLPCMGGVQEESAGARDVVRQISQESAVLPKLMTLSKFWVELELAYSLVWDGADPEQTLKDLSEQMQQQMEKF